MTTAIPKRLPKGWQREGWSERRIALIALPKRVRVLLAAEWARSVLHKFEDKYPNDMRPRKAIEAAENWSKEPSKAAAAAAAAADAAAAAAAYAAAYAAYAYAAAAYAAYADDAAAYAAAADGDGADDAAAAAAAKQKWRWLYTTFRHARGPLRAEFDPQWKTRTCVAIARQISESRDFSAMPILADALQDAGCDCDEVLNHLRGDPLEDMTLADWSIWNLLGYGEMPV